MKYQKIYGKDFNECLMEARMRYGDEAAPIARNLEYVGGMFGKFFRKKRMVVTFRVPEKRKAAKASTELKLQALEKLIAEREKEGVAEKTSVVSRLNAPVGQSDADRLEDNEVLRRLYGLGDKDQAAQGVGQGQSSSAQPGQSQRTAAQTPVQSIPEGLQSASTDAPSTLPSTERGNADIHDRKSILRRPKQITLPVNNTRSVDNRIRLPMDGPDIGDLAQVDPGSGLGDQDSVGYRGDDDILDTDYLDAPSRVGRDRASEGSGAGPAQRALAAGRSSQSNLANARAKQSSQEADAPRLSTARTGGAADGLHIDRLRNRLLEQEMTPAFVENFIGVVEQKLSPENKRDKTQVQGRSIDGLAGIIQAEPKVAGRGSQRVIFVMGPTGVGKTTTIAKLAANYTLKEDKSVAMVTIDNYRIAATEQLKKYADIIGVPLHICRSPLEFNAVLDEEEAELILVDTSGRSPANLEKIKELKDYTDVCRLPIEKHLVISANIRPISIERAVEAYNYVGFDKIILTKLDECEIIGSFVEIADKYNRPFSFLTNGQDVPNDILNAESKEMAEMIIGNI